jgi:hypothetical protein
MHAEANKPVCAIEERIWTKVCTAELSGSLFSILNEYFLPYRCTFPAQPAILYKVRKSMSQEQVLTPVKRKRLLNTYGTPVGYTHAELEIFLDLLYGLFSNVYTAGQLRQVKVSDPFDRTENPRQLTIRELADWLEAVLS